MRSTGSTTDNPKVADPETTPGTTITRGPLAATATAESHWWVQCVDPFGRCRAMNVLVHQGRIMVVAPPGQSAVLSAAQTRDLGTALAAAAARAPGPS